MCIGTDKPCCCCWCCRVEEPGGSPPPPGPPSPIMFIENPPIEGIEKSKAERLWSARITKITRDGSEGETKAQVQQQRRVTTHPPPAAASSIQTEDDDCNGQTRLNVATLSFGTRHQCIRTASQQASQLVPQQGEGANGDASSA